MTWLWSILASLVAGATSCAASIGLGLLCVRWYRISSFEGKSGFAVAGIALLGLVGGLLVGLIAARVVASGGSRGALPQLAGGVGAALAVVLAATAFAFLGSLSRPQ
jgi:hypothetical protein